MNRADGKIAWSAAVPAVQPEDSFSGFLTEHGYASHTPTSDGKRVYVFFGKSGAAAFDLGELRSLPDWFIRFQLNSVPGVAEVGSVGGFVRQYQIEVDSQKMRAVGVSLDLVMMAVGRSNLNVGGKTIEETAWSSWCAASA